MTEKNDWVMKDYFHPRLKRVVPLFAKGGLGILSPAPDVHLIIFESSGQSPMTDKQFLLGHISLAMQVVDWMISKGIDWVNVDTLPFDERKKVVDIIFRLREGGDFDYEQDGEIKSFKTVKLNPLL